MNNLKSISKNSNEFRVANYIVLFGGRDLSNEFFTKNTEYASPYTESSVLHVDFEHGLDPDKLGIKSDHVLGYVDWKTAVFDDKGIFVERVLNRQAKYMKYIEPLIEEGIVGTSSEAVRTGVVKSRNGEIISWPLKRDTLTLTPMEPRMISSNATSILKSLNFELSNHAKTKIDDCNSLKDAENLLRDASNLSKSEATALVSRIKAIVQSDSEKVQKEMGDIFNNFFKD